MPNNAIGGLKPHQSRYTLNMIMSEHLPKKKRPVIAFLVHNLIGEYHLLQLLALHRHAIRRDVSLLFFTPFLFYSQQINRTGALRSFQLAGPENVDGAILSGASLNVFFTPDQIENLRAIFPGLPMVSIATTQRGYPSVVIDNAQGLRELVRHLVQDHGYRQLAFLGGTAGNVDAEHRLTVFKETLAELGVPVDSQLILQGNFSTLSGSQAVAALLDERKRQPDALVCANDEMALGAMAELERRGLKVPRDMALTGFDNIDAASLSRPGLSTVSQGIVAQAERAMDLILDMIARRPFTERVVLPSEMVIRQSCGCQPQVAKVPGELHGTGDLSMYFRDLMYEKGYNLGVVSSFSRTVMGALNLDTLREELGRLASNLRMGALMVVLYNQGSAPAEESVIPRMGVCFFSWVDGREGDAGLRIPVGQLVPSQPALYGDRRTSVVTELVFQNEYYGYCLVQMTVPDPVIIQILSMELSNCLHNMYMKRQMDDAYQKLEELDGLKNEFIANITHDFRSPLTITLGASELGLLDSADDSEDHRRYQVIYDASLRLKHTIDRFLELTRMDQNGLAIHAAPLDIQAFLSEISGFYRSSLLASSIRIAVEMPGEIPGDLVTDREKLEQILNNLISNALKFVDPASGIITIRVETMETELLIRIVDNGIGIPPDKLEAVFERFTQLASGRTNRNQGTGIGLAFSRQLAGLLHGSLEADSEGPGSGACFTLRLPRGKAHFAPDELLPHANQAYAVESARMGTKELFRIQLEAAGPRQTVVDRGNPVEDGDVPTDFRHLTVLIVEDHPDILALERDSLAKAGYRNFVLAPDGLQGLEAAYLYRPDLIVCDVDMPGLRGDELYAQLVSNPDFSLTPFVFVSAMADREFILDLKRRGAGAFLTKPIDTEEFVHTAGVHLKAVHERKKALRASRTDELTGLLTRRSLMAEIRSQFASRRLRDFSFIFLDIDHFKSINDTWGHPVGDVVLKAVGACVREQLRPYDLPGRYGGEEFLMLLPDTGLKDALAAAEKLRAIIAKLEISTGKESLGVQASFGVASLKEHAAFLAVPYASDELLELFEPHDGHLVDWKKREVRVNAVADGLITLADQALYRAKSGGRNRVESAS
jgi:diguanylate cyclase (GGDEF)-like protein